MTKFQLQSIAFDLLPTKAGDCVNERMRKDWKRSEMVERAITYSEAYEVDLSDLTSEEIENIMMDKEYSLN